MDELLLISLGPTPQSPIDWLVWNRNTNGPADSGQLPSAEQLAQLKARARQHPCYVLVPQEQVLATTVTLPNSSRAALAAVPYQIEEQLCQEPEQCHIALGTPLADHTYPVSVVAREQMQYWHSMLLESGLAVRGLMADAQSLDATASEAGGLDLDERILLKSTHCPGLALSRDELDSWREQINPLPSMVMQDQAPTSSLARLAPHLDLAQAINLLQGPFKLKDPVAQFLRRWRLPALLGMLLLLLQLVDMGLENRRLEAHKAQLDQQITAHYRSAFPDAQRIVNPRLQMERALDELRQANAGLPLLRALESSLPAFAAHATVTPKELRYDDANHSITLALEAPDYQTLQRFNSLLSQAGLQSDLGQFSTQGAGTRGQLTIKEVR